MYLSGVFQSTEKGQNRRIEPNLTFIQPSITSGDLHEARTNARCEITANNYRMVYHLFHQGRRGDLANS